jgi:DNA-binding NtrC family response regulator
VEIAEAALARFAREEGRTFLGLDPSVRALLPRLPWPGNVRQVLNVMRNVVVLNQGGWVTPDILPPGLVDLTESEALAPPPAASPVPGPATAEALVGLTLAEAERLLIEATVARHGGSIPKAARVLDVSPSTLYRKIDSWRVPA